eukprot:1522316-Amphidinium_carterae.2
MQESAAVTAGGYPMLTEFPGLPRQERWQDVDNISTSYDITYCPGHKPDLTHDLTAVPSSSQDATARNLSSGGTLADEGRLPDVDVSDDAPSESEKAPMDGYYGPISTIPGVVSRDLQQLLYLLPLWS